jgi:aspartokinase-like uncharacterized kinase
MPSPLWVVKVGGSLYDWPGLAATLRAWINAAPARVVLLPGGGDGADVIRELDRVHRLGEEASHWLALRVLSLNAHLLAGWLQLPVTMAAPQDSHAILDAQAFFEADEANADHLPHRWDVTSDSLAVRAAHRLLAEQLVLLKSTTWDDEDRWADAVQAGVVDAYFTEALKQTPSLRVRAVNLRAWTPSR